LIGLMVYVWAIMMHMLMKQEHEFNEGMWDDGMLGFSTMTRCIWTLGYLCQHSLPWAEE